MELAQQDRVLSVQEAYDALDAFGRRAGRVPLLLLMHAAVPQSFRADLLNLLKQNFLAAEAGFDMTVDADVLLSPLVQPAAASYYRLDPEVRRHCLALLDAAYRERPVRRSIEVSRFLQAYAEALERQAGLALDPLLSEYLAINRWVAASFIDPQTAVSTFAAALAKAADQRRGSASLRLGSVTAALSLPLSGHEGLLAYARGVDALGRGDTDAAERLLQWTRDSELTVGGVSLRSGRDVMARFAPKAPEAPAAPEAAAERPAPADRAPTILRINVPPPPSHAMIGRQRELGLAGALLIARRGEASGESLARRPRVVRIVGEDGIGKWTFANALVNHTDLPAHFTDGVVWLGEDGVGYPVDALDAYARAVGVTDLLDDQRHVRRERFTQLFADRRVLFVAEQRTASDMVPVLFSNAGPDCAVLHLVGTDRTDNPNRVELPPLNEEEVFLLISRIGQGSLQAFEQIIEFAQGNPLLITLAINARRYRLPLKREKDVWTTVDALLASLWRRLPETHHEALRALTGLRPEHRTLFSRSELEALPGPSDLGLPAILRRLHLAEDVGELIRIHARVRSGLMATTWRSVDATPVEGQDGPHEESTGYVFVSYAREDAGAVLKLRETLEGADLEVWTDEDQTGLSQEEIARAIRRAAVVIPVLSSGVARLPASVAFEWRVALEEAQYQRRNIPFVMPVAVDEVHNPAGLQDEMKRIQWQRAPGGAVPAEFVMRVIRAVRGHGNRRRQEALEGGPPSSDASSSVDVRTRDFAVVVSVTEYPSLEFRLRNEANGVSAMIDWLASPQGGGIRREQLAVLGAGTSSPERPEPSHDRIEEAMRALSERVQSSAAAGRRLYLCFCGAFLRATDGSLALLTADATRTRLRSVGVMNWRRYFSDGPFDQLVFVLDGVIYPATEPVLAELPELNKNTSRAPASVFSAVSANDEKDWPGATLMGVMVDGLRGPASDSSGRITSESLQNFVLNRLKDIQKSTGRSSRLPRFETSGSEPIVFVDRPPPSAAV